MDLYSETIDLDVELSKDASGVFLKQVQDALRQGAASIRRQMDRGLPGDEFRKADALRKAYEAALVAVEGAWNGFHRH